MDRMSLTPTLRVCDKLTALSALLTTQTTERSHMRSYLASSFSLSESTESTYNTVVVDVGPAGSVDCVTRVPSKTRL